MMISGAISVLNGRLPAMKMTEPYSPTPPAESQSKPGQKRRKDRRKHHAGEGLPAVGSQALRRLLHFLFQIGQHGLKRPDNEREPHENEGQRDSSGCVDDGETGLGQRLAQPANGRIESGETHPRHGRRQRERKINQRVKNSLSGKRIPDQHPRRDQADDGVDPSRGEGGAEN